LTQSNFEKFPVVKIEGHSCIVGWSAIKDVVLAEINSFKKEKIVIVIDCYHGVYTKEIIRNLSTLPGINIIIDTTPALIAADQISEMVYPSVTDDPVFGFISTLSLNSFFNQHKVSLIQDQLDILEAGVVFIVGMGASLIATHPDLRIYADMPRWEIQLRFRNNKISNLGAINEADDFAYQYKRAFFVDWRVCDRHKKEVMCLSNYFLDTTIPGQPKMVNDKALQAALLQTTKGPFRVVPFFDPGPWGGQWLKEVIDLDRSKENYAWGFDCVPEENSLVFSFTNGTFEIPAINLVFNHPEVLLGEKVYEAFGAEFPIRFDFLDTMGGGNLSLQVHPLMEYIREKFGMGYTQDESYYFLEAEEDAFVYAGLKENIDAENMLTQLKNAQEGGPLFDVEQFVEKWPVKKHDHILIPSGTVHCSGANSVVLEISATPYIFTFKLWDWARMGLDGKPRPISLEHGINSIQWNRTTQWTKQNIINHFEPIATGDGWREERTGLDETSFIETRRHWFTTKVTHHTNGIVNVLNLIEGREAIVESPTAAFEPYVIHYAETFIVPAAVGAYTVRPFGESEGKQCATIKASVRTNPIKNYQLN